MHIPKWVSHLCLTSSLIFVVGCAAVGVIESDDPAQKISDASHLIDQGRPLPAERLIHEAIALYRDRDDPHGLGSAYLSYAALLQSNAVMRAQVTYLRSGFIDKSVTLANRFEKAREYAKLAVVQYETAVVRHMQSQRYDALTNAHLNLAWLHEGLKQRDAACENYQKTLDAYVRNLAADPQAKPQGPRNGQSIPEYVRGLMRAADCEEKQGG